MLGKIKKVKREYPKKVKRNYSGYLWILPALVLILLFSGYPLINAFITSFTSSNGSGYGSFVGFANFIELFKDPVFGICLKNVILFTIIGLVCGNFMTIFLAELLFNFKLKKTSAAFRVLFILPVLVPSVVINLVWENIIFSSNGFLNQILNSMGVASRNWYFDSATDKFAIIMTNFPWVGGTSYLIYLAGLQNINSSVLEACRMDGVTGLRRIFKIDLPLIKGQLKYFLIMGIIGGLQNFDLQLIITGAGPGTSNSVNVPGLYLYDWAWGGTLSDMPRYGYASAIGVILFLITLVFTAINMRDKKNEIGA